MNIKGIHKTSLIDFPGKISSVIFTGGCNLRCGYCHNPDLICNSCDLESYSNQEAISMMEQRKNLIDGISITGGEPTISKNIESFIRSIKKLSLPVKLDTNGLNPMVVKKLIDQKLVDYIAIDVKTSPEKYEFLTGMNVNFNDIVKTIDIVRDSDIEYELRTTCMPYYVTLNDFISIRNAVGSVKKYYLQQFVNRKTLDKSFSDVVPYPKEMLCYFKLFIESFADVCEIRGI
jgi:pyruvate formate lyase activating enzyme